MKRRRQTSKIDLLITGCIAIVCLLLPELSIAQTPAAISPQQTSRTQCPGQASQPQCPGQEEVNPPAKSKQSIKPPKLSEDETKEARELLGALGYWVDLDVSGLDISLRHALIAFQKIAGRPRTGVLTTEEIEALRSARRPGALEFGYAHVEIDLCRQVLFVVDECGALLRILPVSTGTGECFTQGGRTRRAITPMGRFKVIRKVEGWRKSPLGLLYYPNYFYGGVAIHGNPSVPAEPASHGCIRIPMFAAKEFFRMVPIGMAVLIYDNNRALPIAMQ